MEIEDRFWSKVAIGEPNECWPWKAAISKDTGYGTFWYNGGPVGSHRVALELTDPEFDPELDVLHTCDNRPCCNPSHLFQGTDADNAADRNEKGRQAQGERNGAAKLTVPEVEEIRRLRREEGLTYREIADRRGVSVTLVCYIIRGLLWRGL